MGHSSMSTALCTVPAEVVKLASGVQYVDLRTGGGEVRNAWLNGEGTLQIATVTGILCDRMFGIYGLQWD